MYKAFVRAKSGCDKWHDYEMSVAPYETDKPIYYEFTASPDTSRMCWSASMRSTAQRASFRAFGSTGGDYDAFYENMR